MLIKENKSIGLDPWQWESLEPFNVLKKKNQWKLCETEMSIKDIIEENSHESYILETKQNKMYVRGRKK